MTVLHLCGKRAIALALLVAAALVLAAPGAATADDLPDLPDVHSCSDPGAECVDGMPVVPSLDPEWSRSFEPRPLPRLRNFAACRPVSLVFYTATDWFRVAQKMRGNPSACGDYYVFVPALANGDKTQMRPNEAARIRGLGAQMHAAAEINWNAWTTWVANGNGTFYDAGVEARKRMLAVGYDFAAGDTWALNELPSSARTNTGTVRADARAARARPLHRRRNRDHRAGHRLAGRPRADARGHDVVEGEPEGVVRGRRVLDGHEPVRPLLGTGGIR